MHTFYWVKMRYILSIMSNGPYVHWFSVHHVALSHWHCPSGPNELMHFVHQLYKIEFSSWMLSINVHQVKLIDIIYCCPHYEFMDDGWVYFLIFVGWRLYFLLSKTSIYDAIASFKINLFWVNISFAWATPLFYIQHQNIWESKHSQKRYLQILNSYKIQ